MMAKENFFQKAKADGEVFFKTVNLVTQLSKLKMAIRAKKQERAKLTRQIGVSIFEIFQEDRKLDSQKISNATLEDLRAIEAIDAEMIELQHEIDQVRSDFNAANQGKAAGGDSGTGKGDKTSS